MRHELSRALAELDRGLRHENRHGKTFTLPAERLEEIIEPPM